MKIFVVVNGQPMVGKDSFVDLCRERLYSKFGITSAKISSVDAVKEAAKLLGWDEMKCSKGRKFLSDLKDMSTRNYDGPMKYMMSEAERQWAQITFFFIREPEEIEKFVRQNPETITVLVKRGEVQPASCHSDANVFEYLYNYEIDNNRNLAQLETMARRFITDVLLSGSY